MEKETLKRIFNFLEEKEEQKAPFMWKLVNNEPLTKEELDVKDDLMLIESPITSLPEGLKVGGNLNLRWSNITSLPKGLIVGGTLFLASCKQLTSLPEGLKVGGLSLVGSKVSSLPEGLEVEGDLYINNTPIANKYSNDEIRDMVKPDGYILGQIYR